MFTLLLLACVPVPDEGTGLLGDGWANPFPSMHHVDEGHLALDLDALPQPEGGGLLPVERLAWRTGFSPTQTAVVRIPGVDPLTLPHWTLPEPGLGGVLMVDLDTGEQLPVFAELDAHPDQEVPGLLVRPQHAMTPGHQVAVVVLRSAVQRPERFDWLLSDTPPESLADQAPHYKQLINQLEQAGVPSDTVSFAWDFPIGDGTEPLRSAVSQLQSPGTWSIHRTRNIVESDVPPRTFSAAEGLFTVQDFLVDDLTLQLTPEGGVTSTGTADAHLYVHVPESVADKPAESVPVLLFGHGIFSQPSNYLNDDADPSGVLRLADEGGYIVVATKWRGLTTSDLSGALDVANDFSKMPLLGDRLVQGVLNTRTLADMVLNGDLLEDPVFVGASGQSLPRRGRLLYYGISLGGIEGAVLMSTDPGIEAAAIHVGGGSWSTMLERSSNWPLFEDLMLYTVPDPWDRQVLYSVSQLFWDPADPMLYADDLGDRPMLWQESIGDEQVPNMTTRALVRSVGVPLLEPYVEPVWGIDSAAAPMQPGSSAYVQFDPMKALPEDSNRPAEVTQAHNTPRLWEETQGQVLRFLEQGHVGEVQHLCGEQPCTAENATPIE